MVPCDSESNDNKWVGVVSDKELMNISELETHIFMFEQVRVIFRTGLEVMLPRYPFKTPVGDASYLQPLNDRIEKTYTNINFVIIDGEGLIPGLRLKKLKQVRMSYMK